MNALELVGCLALCFGVSFGVLLWIIRLDRGGRLRKRHGDAHHGKDSNVPRIGGIGLAAGLFALPVAISLFLPAGGWNHHGEVAILCGALAMFALGLWDDLRPIGARLKLLGQVLIALVVFTGGLNITKFQVPLTQEIIELGGTESMLVTVIWLVALTNLINLIDGVDGLAGGISLMVMALLVYSSSGSGYIQLLCAGMAGALVAFLIFNFPPARVYMGDGGAYLLGFLIGATTIASSQKGTVMAALIAPLFVLALPILDTGLAILRRGLRGLPVFRPDRRHLHHRMMGLGWSRRRIVLSVYCFCLLFLLLGFAAFWSRGQWFPILVGIGVLIIVIAAWNLSFSREWFAVGRILGNSLQMRADIQYALVQTRWLAMEGRRAASIEDLWRDFVFIAQKLGFHFARLQLADGERAWDGTHGALELKSYRGELQGGRLGVLELKARLVPRASELDGRADPGGHPDPFRPRIVDAAMFEILTDVLVEGWMKATRAWIRFHDGSEEQLRFDMTRMARHLSVGAR